MYDVERSGRRDGAGNVAVTCRLAWWFMASCLQLTWNSIARSGPVLRALYVRVKLPVGIGVAAIVVAAFGTRLIDSGRLLAGANAGLLLVLASCWVLWKRVPSPPVALN